MFFLKKTFPRNSIHISKATVFVSCSSQNSKLFSIAYIGAQTNSDSVPPLVVHSRE